MNLFRSEEHARKWDGFKEELAVTIRPVAEWAEIFSSRYFRERGRTDFISWAGSEEGKAEFAEFRHRANS